MTKENLQVKAGIYGIFLEQVNYGLCHFKPWGVGKKGEETQSCDW